MKIEAAASSISPQIPIFGLREGNRGSFFFYPDGKGRIRQN
jgi:hypothetical protein